MLHFYSFFFMKLHSASFLFLSVFLVACVDTTGLSAESSRPPKGNPNAVVVVTEFSDLQCPACKAAHAVITAPLLSKYGSVIRFEYKHFPLRMLHPHAMVAAMGAECAADQGKFWEFVDKAFAGQAQMSKDRIKTWAAELQLDTELFNRCLSSKIKEDTILADYEEGKNKGVGGTPTFFVNGRLIETDLAKMSAAIEEAAAGAMQRL